MTQMAIPARGGVSVEEVDREEVARNVDVLSRRFLKLSGREFLACRREGALGETEDTAAVSRVLSVATLLD